MLHARTHGSAGPTVIVIHGGPGASGSAAGLARGLSAWFRVLEPWQRASGDEPLTVDAHIADLHELISVGCSGEAPALVGASWGAMLALAFAARHPQSAGPIALVGCGTFDETARARLGATLAARTTGDMRRQVREIERTCADPAERLMRQHRVLGALYDYEPLVEPSEPDAPPFDLRAHRESWDDMLELQRRGVYPAAFRAIRSPVLMLHGEYDPHPGGLIRDGLAPYVAQLAYCELARCGHEPWRERWARDEFFERLRRWLLGGSVESGA